MIRRERRHVERMERAWLARDIREARAVRPGPRRPAPAGRGIERQLARRRAERDIRAAAVVFLRWARRRGMGLAAAAQRLGLAPRTLAAWVSSWKADRMKITARGRRVERPDRDARMAILGLFALLGPGVPVSVLQREFPDRPRAELEEWQRRYRFACLRRNQILVHCLTWLKPGTVLAMDFAEEPGLIDGRWPAILSVRDLASGYQLLWLPVEAMDSAAVVSALTMAFRLFGPPLVMKSDNGVAFTSAETALFFSSQGVVSLFSPPHTPEYNGACEAGIGTMRAYGFLESARNDRPGLLTPDDLGVARQMANGAWRPGNTLGPTPSEAWELRKTIQTWEREAFSGLLSIEREKAQRELGHATEEELRPSDRSAIDRVAISRVLIEGGYLKVRRRRITPPIPMPWMRKIS